MGDECIDAADAAVFELYHHCMRQGGVMELEDKIRVLALKKAAIVMNALAASLQDKNAQNETKSLAWAITWAVEKIEGKK